MDSLISKLNAAEFLQLHGAIQGSSKQEWTIRFIDLKSKQDINQWLKVLKNPCRQPNVNSNDIDVVKMRGEILAAVDCELLKAHFKTKDNDHTEVLTHFREVFWDQGDTDPITKKTYDKTFATNWELEGNPLARQIALVQSVMILLFSHP